MNEVVTPLAALVAGLVGSGHCLLMCGAIVGALGQGSTCSGRSLRYPLLYNLGRIGSYATAGAIAGGAGGAALALLGRPHLRGAFTALAAVVIVAVGLRLAAGARGFGWLDRAGAAAWRRIAPLTRPLFPVTTPGRALGVGLAWGWLPCGMAYAMLAAAAFSGGAAQGALVMASFGAGTLPAMLALGAGTARLLGARTQRAGGVALVLLGIGSLLALGGLVFRNADHEGHAAHGHAASAGVAGDAAAAHLAGQLAELRRVEDAHGLALDGDDAQLAEP